MYEINSADSQFAFKFDGETYFLETMTLATAGQIDLTRANKDLTDLQKGEAMIAVLEKMVSSKRPFRRWLLRKKTGSQVIRSMSPVGLNQIVAGWQEATLGNSRSSSN